MQPSPVRNRLSLTDRVQEIDVLKLEWKSVNRMEEQRHHLHWNVHHNVAPIPTAHRNSTDSNRRIAELVSPIPSWKLLEDKIGQTEDIAAFSEGEQQESPNPPHAKTNVNSKSSLPIVRTLWTVDANGDIVQRDYETGIPLQSIHHAKHNTRPSALRHAPHCAVVPVASLERHEQTIYGSLQARRNVLEEQLAQLTAEDIIPMDFVWTGFVDGSMRIFPSRLQKQVSPHGTGSSSAKQESKSMDSSPVSIPCFELAKSHAAEVVAIELSPYHPIKKAAERDASFGLSISEAKMAIIGSEILHVDQHVRYICTASADSCVAIWDLVDVYRSVHRSYLQYVNIELARLQALLKGAKAPRERSFKHDSSLSAEPIYFHSHRYDITSVTKTWCLLCPAAKPIMKLKGGLCSLRHVRWVSTLVTTEGYDVYSGRRHAYGESAGSEDACSIQTRTRDERREEHKNTLGLSEKDMLQAERVMQGKHNMGYNTDVKEPIVSKYVHFLIAGDASGNILLWNLIDELNKSVEPAGTVAAAYMDKAGSSHMHPLSRHVENSKRPASSAPGSNRGSRLPPPDFDVRSLSSHVTTSAMYARTTDKRIQFSGGASICGLEPLLPPVIHVTMRRSASSTASPPSQRSRGKTSTVTFDYSFLSSPREATATSSSLDEVTHTANSDEFLPLTDKVALFYAYENLEFFVGVDASVQFLSCHPTHHDLESEEELLRLVHAPNRIQAKRGMDDEIVGSLDFNSFSVYFSKRVLEYHPQPISFMKMDPLRGELVVARRDGMTSILSTKQLRVLCRIPHPHAIKTIGPPPQAEVEAGLAEYHHYTGYPPHMDVHPESMAFASSAYTCQMMPVDTERHDGLLCCFGDIKSSIKSVALTSTLDATIASTAVIGVDRERGDHLQHAYEFHQRRQLDLRMTKLAATLKQDDLYNATESGILMPLSRNVDVNIQFLVFWKWSSWSKSRQRKKSAVARTAFTGKHDVLAHKCITERQETYSKDRHQIIREKNLLAETLAPVVSLSLLKKYYCAWHGIRLWQKCRRAAPGLENQTSSMMLRRYFSAWCDRISMSIQHRFFLRQQTKFQFTLQRAFDRDILHNRLVQWSRWTEIRTRSSTQSVRNETKAWLVFHRANTRALCKRYYTLWKTLQFERRSSRGLAKQEMIVQQIVSRDETMVRRRAASLDDVLHLCTDDDGHLLSILQQQHLLMVESLASQHFMACSQLLSGSFRIADVMPDTLLALIKNSKLAGGAGESSWSEDDTESTGSSSRSADACSLLLSDVFHGGINHADAKILFWTAIETTRFNASQLQKSFQSIARETAMNDRAYVYLQKQDEAVKKSSKFRHVWDMFTKLLLPVRSRLDCSSLFFDGMDVAQPLWHLDLTLLMPEIETVTSKKRLAALEEAAVRVLNEFIAPFLETLLDASSRSSLLRYMKHEKPQVDGAADVNDRIVEALSAVCTAMDAMHQWESLCVNDDAESPVVFHADEQDISFLDVSSLLENTTADLSPFLDTAADFLDAVEGGDVCENI